jgi:hypothetical protein
MSWLLYKFLVVHLFLYFLITEITMKYVIKVNNSTLSNKSNIYSI